MAITTTSVFAPAVAQNFARKMLSIETPEYIHKIAAVRRTMPEHAGHTYRMRRLNRLQPALVPLGNSGITPPGQTLSAIDIDAKISFYGTYVELNEQTTLQNECPVLNSATELLGICLRETEDNLIKQMLESSASAINCTAGTNGDNPTEITATDVDTIVKTLKMANAKPLADTIEASKNFGTAPVRYAYFGMCSSMLIGQLDIIPNFQAAAQYSSSYKALPSEWGCVSNLRFLTSSEGSYNAAASNLGNTVYNMFCMGQDAYSIIDQNMYSAKLEYRGPEFSGPMLMNSTVCFKMAQAQAILSDKWILKARCTIA